MTVEAPDRFDVLIVPFPFAERDFTKQRPAVVISSAAFNAASGTAILAMITSARKSDWPEDQAIDDIEAAGLRSLCKVRMKLFSIDLRRGSPPVGRLAVPDGQKVESALRRMFAS